MKGMIYMTISSVTAAIMALVLKYLFIYSNITAFEVTYWQSIIIIIVEYVMLKWSKKDQFKVPSGIRVTFVLRCITGFLGTLGYFIAIQFVELSRAAVLYWTNPMFTAVISYLWLKESLSLIDWGAILASFCGILIIQNPWSSNLVAQETSER